MKAPTLNQEFQMKIWFGEQSLKSMEITGQIKDSSTVSNVKSVSRNPVAEGNCSSKFQNFRIPYTDYVHFVILMETSNNFPHVWYLQSSGAHFYNASLNLTVKCESILKMIQLHFLGRVNLAKVSSIGCSRNSTDRAEVNRKLAEMCKKPEIPRDVMVFVFIVVVILIWNLVYVFLWIVMK